MVPGALEKLGFGGAAVVLWLQGRLDMPMIAFGGIDIAFAVLFLVAFRMTPEP